MLRKILTIAGVILLVLMSIAAIRYRNQGVAAQLALNNTEAERDTIQTHYDGLTKVVGKLAETVRDLDADNDDLRGVVKDLGARLMFQGDVTLSYRNQIIALTTARADGDSTRIPIEFQDDIAQVEAVASFPGRIAPDPEPTVTTIGEIRIPRLDLTIAVVEDPETCAPRFLVQTTSPLIKTTRVDGRVAFESTCLHDRERGFFEINADFGIGGLIGGLIGFLAGAVAGS